MATSRDVENTRAALEGDLETVQARLEGKLTLVHWMVGFVLAFVVAIAWKVFS